MITALQLLKHIEDMIDQPLTHLEMGKVHQILTSIDTSRQMVLSSLIQDYFMLAEEEKNTLINQYSALLFHSFTNKITQNQQPSTQLYASNLKRTYATMTESLRLANENDNSTSPSL